MIFNEILWPIQCSLQTEASFPIQDATTAADNSPLFACYVHKYTHL